jgi:hypothetical protein
MTGAKGSHRLRPEDLELLDYIIARAIDACIEALRSSHRERANGRPPVHASSP